VQAKRDPAKEWLQLSYCVRTHDIHIEVHEWPEEWKVPIIPRIVSGGQNQMQDRIVPAQQRGTNSARKKKNVTKGQVGGNNPNAKETKDIEETIGWFHTRATMHRKNTTSYNRIGACGRRNDRDIVNTHGGKSWAGDRHGYTNSRGI